MTRSQATPASSQIITLTRMLEEREGEIERLCAERDRVMDGMLTLGTELRAIEAALDDERINLTHTAAQVAAEMRDKINELHAQIERLRAQTAPSVPAPIEGAKYMSNDWYYAEGWIDPNDKTQTRYLPHIGEPVLFSHKGRVYYGKHTGGSFTAGAGVCAQHFVTWDCMWRPIPAAPGAQETNP